MDKTYFQSSKALIAEFRKKMSEEGKKFFSEQAKELFEHCPELVKFGWTQYTPYFNDGEACYFSANLGSPKILFKGEDEDLYEERWYSEGEEGYKPLATVVEFLGQFDDDDVEMLFGDHCEVTVTRNGVEVEEYEHD